MQLAKGIMSELIEQAKAVICLIPFNRLQDSPETRAFLMALEQLRQTIHKIEDGKDQ